MGRSTNMSRTIAPFFLTILLLAVVSWKPQNSLTFDRKQQVGFEKGALSSQSSAAAISSEKNAGLYGTQPVISEQMAVVSASDHLAINGVESYYPGMTQEGVGAVREPRWAMELEARGKTATNLFQANDTASPRVRSRQAESGKRYIYGVGLALTKKNSSLQIRLMSKAGQVIRSLALSSPRPLFWRCEIGEFIAAAADSPGHLEVTAVRGKAYGFFSISDVNTSETTLLTLLPARRPGRGGTIHIATNRGTGYFTHGILDCPGSSYAYEINDGPPSSCGTLHIV